jgi:RNA polymerase sigma-70 factor (ECF subfamily)
MSAPDQTRQSLLARVRSNGNAEAWREFIDLYSPFVFAYLRRRGLQSADAADVMQEVMRTVFASLDDFEHRQRAGSFRKWLVSITRSRMCDFFAEAGRNTPGSGDSAMVRQLAEQPEPEDERQAELEYQRCLFRWAADRSRHEFQENTWQAFWQTSVDGRACKDVATELGMSLEAVYMARGRILARLRKKINEAEGKANDE